MLECHLQSTRLRGSIESDPSSELCWCNRLWISWFPYLSTAAFKLFIKCRNGCPQSAERVVRKSKSVDKGQVKALQGNNHVKRRRQLDRRSKVISRARPSVRRTKLATNGFIQLMSPRMRFNSNDDRCRRLVMEIKSKWNPIETRIHDAADTLTRPVVSRVSL